MRRLRPYGNLPRPTAASTTTRRLLMLLIMVSSCLTTIQTHADDETKPIRPVTSAYMLEAGSGHLADTYLSPLKYDGWHAAFNYERRQAMRFDPERWMMHLGGGIALDRTDNPARNATMWSLMLDAEWGMERRWQIPYGLTVTAGGSTSIEGGCLYSARNGNNPASAKAAWTVNATVAIAWPVRIGRLPILLRYGVTMPVTGLFFAPDYGELYYEIYLGDRAGLVHGAWWGNYLKIDNLVTADLQFGATTLRLGYRGNILSTKADDVTTRMVSHSVVIGIVSEWISLSPGHRPDPEARIISARY
ncbi:MAG: DUF3316 domain-containing protein [Pseudoflavonifractor sp.]|nr:DUF3316 domain-containing protein [Pseudoflavonifractor sp.]